MARDPIHAAGGREPAPTRAGAEPDGTNARGDGELPRFVRTWERAYLLVLGNLALCVVLFYWLRKAYE